jgi:hypothetical protein
MVLMSADHIHYDTDLIIPAKAWGTLSVASAKPYLKAIGVLLTLIIGWAGLCTI